jgi:hypothetical protein
MSTSFLSVIPIPAKEVLSTSVWLREPMTVKVRRSDWSTRGLSSISTHDDVVLDAQLRGCNFQIHDDQLSWFDPEYPVG